MRNNCTKFITKNSEYLRDLRSAKYNIQTTSINQKRFNKTINKKYLQKNLFCAEDVTRLIGNWAGLHSALNNYAKLLENKISRKCLIRKHLRFLIKLQISKLKLAQTAKSIKDANYYNGYYVGLKIAENKYLEIIDEYVT